MLDRRTVLIATFSLLMACVPLGLVSLPPIADMPNHLARIHILRDGGTNPFLAAYYSIDWPIIPNLAMDVLLTALSSISLNGGAKALLVLIFIGMLVGVGSLSRAIHGRLGVLFMLSALLFYNRILLWGMVNYLTGVVLMLIGVALWLRMRESKPLWRVLVSSLMATAIFFCHLFPFGLYAIALGAYELQRLSEQPNRNVKAWASTAGVGGVQFLFPLYAFFCLAPTSGFAHEIGFGHFSRKLVNIPFMTFNNYNVVLDVLTFVGVGAIALYCLWRGYIRIARPMWGVIAAFTLTHFLMPQFVMSSPGADIRTFIPLVLIGLASLSVQAMPKRLAYGLVGAFVALFVVRTGVVAHHWHRAEVDVLPEYETAISHMGEGAKVATYVMLNERKWFVDPPHQHYVTLAIIEKSAFVARLWAHPAQQPVVFAPEYRALAARMPQQMQLYPEKPLVPDMTSSDNPYHACRFVGSDLFLLANAAEGRIGHLPPFLMPIYEGEHVRLYRIDNILLADVADSVCRS
ncbi:hypothetical protein [Kordiimonas sp.]|uniref:hypothetical protein n=1 Tax=Kordiimonas sp. TaxID=1970157 RepID=UPI003A929B85